jgi:hypothetical protein
VLLVVLAGVAAIVLSRGVYDSYDRVALIGGARQARAPAWTRPCWATARTEGKPKCVHVTGRVVWIQKHDPDGDGDRHLIIVSRLRPRIVKLERTFPIPRLPRIGTRIDVVGWLDIGASRHHEVRALRYAGGGETISR